MHCVTLASPLRESIAALPNTPELQARRLVGFSPGYNCYRTADAMHSQLGIIACKPRRFCDQRQGIVAHFGAELNWTHWTYDIKVGLHPC